MQPEYSIVMERFIILTFTLLVPDTPNNSSPSTKDQRRLTRYDPDSTLAVSTLANAVWKVFNMSLSKYTPSIVTKPLNRSKKYVDMEKTMYPRKVAQALASTPT
ncbi:hypothetical protein Adt_33453 [Abeliophyllum distichum]|uniref:Uncharacterized protein n=1 Tax=Abeliophyllum distichum TaxID=126358 RepID=A0ABD1QXK7_9LAMI